VSRELELFARASGHNAREHNVSGIAGARGRSSGAGRLANGAHRESVGGLHRTVQTKRVVGGPRFFVQIVVGDILGRWSPTS
jgi:hypothetical protein